MKLLEPTPRGSDWITPREAASYPGVGVDIIYDACAAGGLKHARLGHRTIRLRREWLDACCPRWSEQPGDELRGEEREAAAKDDADRPELYVDPIVMTTR